MDIVKTVAALLLAKRTYSFAPVLVPTMGALHDGHLELIKRARSIAGPNGCVAVSIFVNPIQFDRASDLEGYPSTLEQDVALCEKHGVDILYTPDANSLYAANRSITISESSLSSTLCGATREGHFDGVCTVVAKLFNLFTPTDAVFGKKDFQQLAIINRMVRDLNFPVIINAVETLREDDGLALSSRNLKLTHDARTQAPSIRKALLLAQSALVNGDRSSSSLLSLINDSLTRDAPISKIDYLECVDAESLQSVETIDRRAVIAIATFMGDVRLIDNIELVPSN
jgi:pantoate--beta-alanine ligase